MTRKCHTITPTYTINDIATTSKNIPANMLEHTEEGVILENRAPASVPGLRSLALSRVNTYIAQNTASDIFPPT